VFLVRRPIVPAVLVAAGVLAGSSFAYVCHPSAAGTRMLTLKGAVVSLKTRGANVGFVLKKPAGSCSRIVWSTATGVSTLARAACPAPLRVQSSTVLPALRSGDVDVARGGGNRPDVLNVFGAGGHLVRSLPLPARPETLSSSGGIAVFAARGQGVFAIRLSDGLFGFLGPDGGSFAPRLDANGVLFHDGESKLALRAGKTVVEYMTRAAVLRTIARTARPLVTGGPIRSLSMDGPRVAVAVGDTSGRCDRVLYWNVAWNPAQRVSSAGGPTCMVRPENVQIPAVAIGGFRAEWLVTENGGSRLVAGSPLCQEWVLGRYGRVGAVTSLTGDGGTLAFAATTGARTTVSVVNAAYRPLAVASGQGSPKLAADGSRIAILWPDGRVEVVSRSGKVLAELRSRPASAVSLQGNELVTLGDGRLSAFDVRAAKLIRRYRVAASATGADLQDGVVAFAEGTKAIVLDLTSGRAAVVGHAPTKLVGAQIEAAGLAYAWSSGSRGEARFVTTRQLDLALGRPIV
jgi:hypothetical protein